MTIRFLILTLFLPAFSFGQVRLDEKFVNEAFNENNYLEFQKDSTFKYRFSYHLLHDISCGEYKVVNDTILLFFQTGLRDGACNAELDADTHFDSSTWVFRPARLLYEAGRLYKIENGQVIRRTKPVRPDWKVPKSSRHYYRRKYVVFGQLVSKTRKTYYMVVASKAKWAHQGASKASR